jgi:uncharacterized membrane protein
MRGAFLIMVLIAALILGILVFKNYYSGDQPEESKTEMIKNAEKSAEIAEEAINDLNRRLNESMK